MKKYEVIAVTSELGAGTRGAGLGIESLKGVARSLGESVFHNLDLHVVANRNELLDAPPVHPYAKCIEGISEVGKSVCERVSKTAKDQGHAVVLSGDHSMAFATISGLKKAHPNKTLGIVWIDAHADLHTPYTSPSGNVHGMPLAIAAAEDNKPSQINDPSSETLKIWEDLKAIGHDGAKYSYDNLFYIGVRSTETPEEAVMERNGITNVTVGEFRKVGIEGVVDQVKSQLADCDIVYISFDVDSMDPSVSRGTGTPVEGGLTFEEAFDLNSRLAKWERVKAWEMVEINPLLDTKNAMAKAGYKILKEILEVFNNK